MSDTQDSLSELPVTTEIIPEPLSAEPPQSNPAPELPITTDVVVSPPPDVPPTPPVEPLPPQPVEAAPTTVPAPLPPPNPEPAPPIETPTPTEPPEPALPQPAPHAVPQPPPQTNPGGIPASVLALSDAELRAASTLYTQRHQRELSRQAVESRQAAMREKLARIEAQIRNHGTVQIPRLARDLNMSPGLMSHYLQILVKQGKVKAEGHAADRRYSAP